MKKGHKEYRIFSNLDIKNESEYKNKLEIWRKDKTYIEERIDLYIFPLNLEKAVNERFGLKFRNVSIKNDNFRVNKLELKVRNDRSSEGIENWSKIIKKKLEPFNILTVINNSDISDNRIILNLNEISYSLNLIKALEAIKTILLSYNTNEVLNYSKSFENFPLGFVFTFKNRSCKDYEEDVMIKSYYFEVNEKENAKLDAKLCFKRSLCVEKEVKKDIIENLNNELEGYTIAGYPEELLKLFAKI
jgi:hypothetical protein